MAGNIEDLFGRVTGLKADYKIDWREDAKADWKFDFDAVSGSLPGAAPANTVLPEITGLAITGETLTVTDGTWTGNPAPSLTYQWRVQGTPVEGATSSTYVVQAADETYMVDAVVTATNSEGVSSATAVAVGPVAAPAP